MAPSLAIENQISIKGHRRKKNEKGKHTKNLKISSPMPLVLRSPTLFLRPSTMPSVITSSPSSAVSFQLVFGPPAKPIGIISAPFIFSRSSSVNFFLPSITIFSISTSTPIPGALLARREIPLPYNCCGADDARSMKVVSAKSTQSVAVALKSFWFRISESISIAR